MIISNACTMHIKKTTRIHSRIYKIHIYKIYTRSCTDEFIYTYIYSKFHDDPFNRCQVYINIRKFAILTYYHGAGRHDRIGFFFSAVCVYKHTFRITNDRMTDRRPFAVNLQKAYGTIIFLVKVGIWLSVTETLRTRYIRVR